MDIYGFELERAKREVWDNPFIEIFCNLQRKFCPATMLGVEYVDLETPIRLCWIVERRLSQNFLNDMRDAYKDGIMSSLGVTEDEFESKYSFDVKCVNSEEMFNEWFSNISLLVFEGYPYTIENTITFKHVL